MSSLIREFTVIFCIAFISIISIIAASGLLFFMIVMYLSLLSKSVYWLLLLIPVGALAMAIREMLYD